MSKKKSLGHNPLAYSTRRHASFDFITSPAKGEEDTAKEENEASQENERVQKVTASYYLEHPLVKKIKYLAGQKGTSYSALVNNILKDALKDISKE